MDVIGLGAGGHSRVVIEILQLGGQLRIVGLLDPRAELHGVEIHSIKILGDDSLLPKLRDEGITHAFIGVGTVGDIRPRLKVYEKVRQAGFELVPAIHPRAFISPTANIGAGLTIMAGAIVNPLAIIGDNVIVNTAASVDHDCRLGDHVHISPGANLGGGVTVGARSMIGMGAIILPGVTIGMDVIVGAGSLVKGDVPNGKVVVGTPGRVIRDNPALVG